MMLLRRVLLRAPFTRIGKLARESALNGLHFFPKPVRQRACEPGLTDRETFARKGRGVHDDG